MNQQNEREPKNGVTAPNQDGRQNIARMPQTGEVKTPRNGRSAVAEDPKTVTYAMISLLSGIISVLCFCSGFGGFLFGGMAIAFFFVSKKNMGVVDFRSVIGLILGALGILFSAFLVYVILSAYSPERTLLDNVKQMIAELYLLFNPEGR